MRLSEPDRRGGSLPVTAAIAGAADQGEFKGTGGRRWDVSGNSAKFKILQAYNRVNILIPVDAPHMWHAAIGSKTCRLTVLGEHYRRLVEQGLL